MRRLLVIVLIGTLLIAACGNNQDNGSGGELAGRSNSNNTAVPSASPPPLAMDVTGTLLYMQGDALYRWQAEEPLASGIVMPLATTFSPDRQYLLYSTNSPSDTVGASGPVLESLELSTDEKHPLLTFRLSVAGPARWFVESWSDDGQWAIVNASEFASGTSAVKLDGSAQVELSQGFNKGHFWMEDNQIMVASSTFSNDSLLVTSIEVVDLMTGEVTQPAVELPIQATSLRRIMQELGYELDASFSISTFFGPSPSGEYRVRPPVSEGSPAYCSEWQIVDRSNNTILQLASLGGITDLNTLPDGSLMFIRWKFPDCDFLATPNGDLVHFVDGQQQLIAQGLGTSAVRNIVSSQGFFWDGGNEVYRYALAPNGQSVAWIGYSDDGETSTVHITDLQSLETTPIMTTSNAQDSGFGLVFWL